jgi:hypothetical protein
MPTFRNLTDSLTFRYLQLILVGDLGHLGHFGHLWVEYTFSPKMLGLSPFSQKNTFIFSEMPNMLSYQQFCGGQAFD